MQLVAFQSVTLAMVIGVTSYILSRKLRIPAILFYLFCGLLVGKAGFGFIDPDSLGGGLHILLEIVVAIILFEGGLSLKSHSFKSESSAIRRILVITLPLTGIGAALLAHFVLDLSWKFAIFFGALIVVTGPTVVGSILKSVYLSRRLEILLNWESIWGDVIGVLVSAVALEMVTLDVSNSLGIMSLNFILSIIGGTAIGLLSGFLLTHLLNWVSALRDSTLYGIIAFTGAVATFFVANAALHSSGPLAAAVSGFYLSNKGKEYLHEIRHFKEQISSLLISTMFVLLSAYVNPFSVIDQWGVLLLVALVLGALVRPLSVMLALSRSNIPLNEQIFLGIIGPRGIIAVATAAYASLSLNGFHHEMNIVLNLTFAIIFFSGVVATISCRPLAKILKVNIPYSRTGILVVGINPFSSAIAEYASKYVPVSFLETDVTKCRLAGHLGLKTICTDVLDSDVYEDALDDGFCRMLAVTRNDALNELIANKASIHLDPEKTFRVPSNSDLETIKMVAIQNHRIAFSPDFSLSKAEQGILDGTASIKLLQTDEIASLGAIPLMAIVDQGKGLKIVTPSTNSYKEALCLVFTPNDSNKAAESDIVIEKKH